MITKRLFLLLGLLVGISLWAEPEKPWSEITYPCPHDNSQQPAMFYQASGEEARPLLLALHTWSGDYSQNCNSYGNFCVKKNWHFIFPDFRGPNLKPQALGSELMLADIVAAVEFVKKTAKVDTRRIYLIGGSGGGHATLLLAGRHPEIWAAASAWCPISDVLAWHQECSLAKRGYAQHIERACGGNPATSQEARAEAIKRSPLTYLAAAKAVPLDIATGIHDGHTGSVPVSHSLNAYNVLAKPEERIPEADIEYITANRAVPAHYVKPAPDPIYHGKYLLHFRKQSNRVRVTLFEGGHSILSNVGLLWLEQQCQGQEPVWDIAQVQAEAINLAK